MAMVITKEKRSESLIGAVEEISGVSVSECLQCKKCSNGCPVAGLTNISPSETIRRLQLNAGDELFESNLVWSCVSCEICYSRCPMKIDMAAVMDALRILAIRKKTAGQKGNVYQFNKSFLNSIRLFGRTFDLGMMGAYKLATKTYMQDTDKFPMMLRKRKIALLPSLKGDRKSVKRIFKNKDKSN